MSDPLKKDEFTQAVEYLLNDDRFHVILSGLVEAREHRITTLGTYASECELRKCAAEITAFTNLLDIFGVPTGTSTPPSQTMA